MEPHEFLGRLDRRCELCNKPDRDPIHTYRVRTSICEVCGGPNAREFRFVKNYTDWTITKRYRPAIVCESCCRWFNAGGDARKWQGANPVLLTSHFEPMTYGLPVGTRAMFKTVNGKLYIDPQSIQVESCGVCGTVHNVSQRRGALVCNDCYRWYAGIVVFLVSRSYINHGHN